MAALGWLLNLGFAGSEAGEGVPTIPGPEYTIPPGRMHYTVPEGKLHATVPKSRLHYTAPIED